MKEIKYRYLNVGEDVIDSDEYWHNHGREWLNCFAREPVTEDASPVRRPMTPAECAADEMLALLKTAKEALAWSYDTSGILINGKSPLEDAFLKLDDFIESLNLTENKSCGTQNPE